MKAWGLRACLILVPTVLWGPGVALSQTRYLAFGDSITAGAGDEGGGEDRGYPPRLEVLLRDQGIDARVENHGQGSETTAAGVTRIDEVLALGGDVLLLMEGTNDISRRISRETIRFNLNEMARKAEERGLEAIHVTVVPRLPSANTDGNNRATAGLAGEIRDLAWTRERRLADPFEVLFHTPNVFDEFYVGGSDRLHPNARGYDLLAQVLADVLTGSDRVPPVLGDLDPADAARNVAADTDIRLRIYDFGEGIDTANTFLRINGQAVDATLTGDPTSAELLYQPPQPLRGGVTVGLHSEDLAVPPNRADRTLGRFLIQGTLFLDGDIDEDGRVDGVDLVAFALSFGALEGQSRYVAKADFNEDGIVDGNDLATLASNFGTSSF